LLASCHFSGLDQSLFQNCLLLLHPRGVESWLEVSHVPLVASLSIFHQLFLNTVANQFVLLKRARDQALLLLISFQHFTYT
jgi:hypothetical protein